MTFGSTAADGTNILAASEVLNERITDPASNLCMYCYILKRLGRLFQFPGQKPWWYGLYKVSKEITTK